ncbi:hypothetical protein [Microbulbifer thermotolerans]
MRADIIDYIVIFCNIHWLHSYFGYRSPHLHKEEIGLPLPVHQKSA